MGMIRSIRRNMMREAMRAQGARGINRKRRFRGDDAARSTFSKAWHKYMGATEKAEKKQQKQRVKLFQRRNRQKGA